MKITLLSLVNLTLGFLLEVFLFFAFKSLLSFESLLIVVLSFVVCLLVAMRLENIFYKSFFMAGAVISALLLVVFSYLVSGVFWAL